MRGERVSAVQCHFENLGYERRRGGRKNRRGRRNRRGRGRSGEGKIDREEGVVLGKSSPWSHYPG